MFKTNPDAIKLADEIYVFKNFLSTNECSEILASLETFSKSGWANSEEYSDSSEVTPYLQVVKGANVVELYQRLADFVGPDFEPLPSNSINRLLPGQSLHAHWDSPGEEEQVPDGVADPYQTCHIVKYGTVVYLSEFEGGEIYYSRLGIEYKPSPGDLVIHSSFEEYEHGVRSVISGTRYVYSTFLIEKGRTALPTLTGIGHSLNDK
jgi:hypothetical protein